MCPKRKDPCLMYGWRRLQPSYYLPPGQQNISQLGTNLIRLQGVAIPSGLPYHCGHHQLSPWWLFCSGGCVWSGNGLWWWFLATPPPGFALLGSLCGVPACLIVWGCSLALVDFLCTPVALAKQSLSFLENPMGC